MLALYSTVGFGGRTKKRTRHVPVVREASCCEFPKDFKGPPIGVWEQALVRDLIEEDWSGAACSLLNLIIIIFG